MPMSVVLLSLAEMLPLIVKAPPVAVSDVCVEEMPAGATVKTPLVEVSVTTLPVVSAPLVANVPPVAVMVPEVEVIVPRLTLPVVGETRTLPVVVVITPANVSLAALVIVTPPAPPLIVVAAVCAMLLTFVVVNVTPPVAVMLPTVSVPPSASALKVPVPALVVPLRVAAPEEVIDVAAFVELIVVRAVWTMLLPFVVLRVTPVDVILPTVRVPPAAEALNVPAREVDVPVRVTPPAELITILLPAVLRSPAV